jgi:hypothetical protein
MKNKLTIIIQGFNVSKIEKLLKRVFQDFNESEVFLSIPNNIKVRNLSRIKKYKIKFVSYTPQKEFLDYGNKTKNFLNYFLSICEAIKLTSKNYILIINSDFNYKKIDFSNYKFKQKELNYYDFTTKIDKILLFTNKYKQTPSLIFGRKSLLKKMFNFSQNSYPNIFNTTIFPINILKTKDSYLSIEDILKIIFIKKSLDKTHRKINFDEIIGNFHMFDKKIFNSFIKIKLPF